MFKPRLRIPRVSLPRPRPMLRRLKHVMPNPGYSGINGIPTLLTRESFQLAWDEYMTFVLERLNQLTGGTQYEQMDMLDIIKRSAREPSQAPIFNYASMAHNNHFFFKNLRNDRDPNEPNPIPAKLKEVLEESFSSIETLQREMIITANAMFGPGFVWLVKNQKSSQFRVLATYLAGSPYSFAHWRRQGYQMNTAAGPGSSEGAETTKEYLDRQKLASGADNGSKFAGPVAPGGLDVVPILCVNTWEHVWLRDYGIGVGGLGGKSSYLMNWWESVDWSKVADNAMLPSDKFRHLHI